MSESEEDSDNDCAFRVREGPVTLNEKVKVRPGDGGTDIAVLGDEWCARGCLPDIALVTNHVRTMPRITRKVLLVR